MDARDVYVVELKLGTASKVTKTLWSMSLILGCKHYTTCWCVSVRTVGNDPETVVVQLPLRTFKLLDVAAAALRDETNEVTKLTSIVLKTCVVQWSTLRQGIVVKTIRNNIKPKVATSRKPASPAPSSAAPSSSTDVPAVHDDDVFEVPEGLVDHDLEAEVEDTLEDEFAMGVRGVEAKGLHKDLPQDASLLIVKTRPTARPTARRPLSKQFDHMMLTQMSLQRSMAHTSAASFVMPRREHDSRRRIPSKLTATLCHWCELATLVTMGAQ